MKILRYILLASLTCALSACEKDEILPEPEPPVVTPGDDPEKDEEEKIRLGITASLQAMQTKGIIEHSCRDMRWGCLSVLLTPALHMYIMCLMPLTVKNGMPAGTLR